MEEKNSRLRDIVDLGYQTKADPAKVRTQIYLSEEQRIFLHRESKRTGLSMAELIRQYIEERMKPGDEVWDSNPLLDATPDDPDFADNEDGSTNTDAILYGSVAE